MFLQAASLLWAIHLRGDIAASSSSSFYALPPDVMMSVYGSPGTLRRFAAMCLELLLFVTIGERLCSMTSALLVAALSLLQCKKAFGFVQSHPQPAGPDALTVAAAKVMFNGRVKRWECAARLMNQRWRVLRAPMLVLCLSTAKLLGLAAAGFGARRFQTWSSKAPGCGALIEAELLLCIGVCLAWPLMVVLVAAAMLNRETSLQTQLLAQGVDGMVSKSRSTDDALCCTLRLESRHALDHLCLRWPGGQTLGFFEPAILAFLLLMNALLLFPPAQR